MLVLNSCPSQSLFRNGALCKTDFLWADNHMICTKLARWCAEIRLTSNNSLSDCRLWSYDPPPVRVDVSWSREQHHLTSPRHQPLKTVPRDLVLVSRLWYLPCWTDLLITQNSLIKTFRFNSDPNLRILNIENIIRNVCNVSLYYSSSRYPFIRL